MRNPRLIKTSLLILIALSVPMQQAFATKLTAPPLPHEKDAEQKFADNDDSETIIPSTATRFSRRHDYREDDKAKKDAADQAAKDAASAKDKQTQAYKDAVKEALQTAVNANNEAVALGRQGRWEEAIVAHEKAVQYDPRNKQFLINLSAARTTYGQQRMAKGDLTAASNLFRKALVAASDNGMAGKQLVVCLKKMGYNPSDADTRVKLGDQLAAAGDFPGACIEYTAAMQLDPSAPTYIKMGDMAYRYGQVSQALNWYRQAIVKDPDYGAAHRQLGMVELVQKDYTSAAASLRKAVILDSKDVAAGQALVDMWRKQVATNPLLAENHLGLAGALQLTGDFVGADSEYRKLEALDPRNPSLAGGRASLEHALGHARAEKHKVAADTLFNQGLRKEAMSEISQAVTIEPRNAAYQYLLGECLESEGDYQGAHEAYLTCVLIDPENNKDAAARIRMMQEKGTVATTQTAPVANRVANRLAGQYGQMQSAPNQMNAPMQNAPANQMNQMQMQMNNTATYQQQAPQQMSAPQSTNFGYRKNMYEGGNGMPTSAQGFRTHDESNDAALASAAPQASSPSIPEMPSSATDGFAKVADAEAQKDYSSAISILRDMSASNLQNPDIHHRLAVNLLAAGQIGEAISEFRIASALSPTKKAYSDDLAQALAINKRSLMTENSNGNDQNNGGMGAIK